MEATIPPSHQGIGSNTHTSQPNPVLTLFCKLKIHQLGEHQVLKLDFEAEKQALQLRPCKTMEPWHCQRGTTTHLGELGLESRSFRWSYKSDARICDLSCPVFSIFFWLYIVLPQNLVAKNNHHLFCSGIYHAGRAR